MVTAFDDRKARLRGIEVGADDFIPKPYDTLELKARVRTITRLNRYRRLLVEKSKFRLIADLAQNGYMLITKDGRCTFANHQARLYLGLPIDMETELDVPLSRWPNNGIAANRRKLGKIGRIDPQITNPATWSDRSQSGCRPFGYKFKF